ncbi:ribokinase [Chloropicon primus]|nr:ribokinase [Chloropicon primus]
MIAGAAAKIGPGIASLGEMKPLVVVGSANADFVLSVDRLPCPGETVSASASDLFPGGKGANQAAAAARLGHETIFIGQRGADANGDFLRDALVESGVKVHRLKTVPNCSTGSAYIFLQPSGENSIVILGGANQKGWELAGEDEEAISAAGAVLLQREIPEHVNLAVSEVAKRHGVPVILDAGGVDAPLDEKILRNLSVLSPNETELARLTGMPTGTDGEMMKAAQSLLSLDVGKVLIKLGSRGSVMVSKEGPEIKQRALPVDKVADTTGAGDCFTAAFAVGYVQGWPLERCMLFASQAASLCIQKKGAMVSLPFANEMPLQGA